MTSETGQTLNDMPRATDDRLFQLCEDFSLYATRFDAHVSRFEEYEANEQKKFELLVSVQQRNTDAISELTVQTSSLVSDTSDIINLHKDLQSAAKVGVGVQNFIIWLTKWGVVGAAVAGAVEYIKKYWSI